MTKLYPSYDMYAFPPALARRYLPGECRRTLSVRMRKTAKLAKRTRISTRKHALFVRRRMDSKGLHWSTVVDITSPGLCEVLKEINKGVKGLNLTKASPNVSESRPLHMYNKF